MVFVSRNISFFLVPQNLIVTFGMCISIDEYIWPHQKKQINMYYTFLALLLYELYPSSLCFLRLHKSQLVCFYPQHTTIRITKRCPCVSRCLQT